MVVTQYFNENASQNSSTCTLRSKVTKLPKYVFINVFRCIFDVIRGFTSVLFLASGSQLSMLAPGEDEEVVLEWVVLGVVEEEAVVEEAVAVATVSHAAVDQGKPPEHVFGFIFNGGQNLT